MRNWLDTRTLAVAIVLAATLASVPAMAGILQSRAGGAMLYDPVSNVTWLANANHAWTTDYDDVVMDATQVRANGQMTWTAANAWAQSLDISGVTGWRLPTIDNFSSSCFGTSADADKRNCYDSEFETLFFDVIDATFGRPLASGTNAEDFRQFDNWQRAISYWSGSISPNDPNSALLFINGGIQFNSTTAGFGYAIAVIDGDVGLGIAPPPPVNNSSPQLQVRLGGAALYDPLNDVTWLSDANHPGTVRYDLTIPSTPDVFPDGSMTWQAALDWAASLDINGVTGWRLPEIIEDQACISSAVGAAARLACYSGEYLTLYKQILAHLASDNMGNNNDPDYALFDNWQTRFNYWSASENLRDTSGGSVHGWSPFGGVVQDSKSARRYTIAVVDGDVFAVSQVPAPATLGMFALGLLALGGALRRR